MTYIIYTLTMVNLTQSRFRNPGFQEAREESDLKNLRPWLGALAAEVGILFYLG